SHNEQFFELARCALMLQEYLLHSVRFTAPRSSEAHKTETMRNATWTSIFRLIPRFHPIARIFLTVFDYNDIIRQFGHSFLPPFYFWYLFLSLVIAQIINIHLAQSNI